MRKYKNNKIRLLFKSKITKQIIPLDDSHIFNIDFYPTSIELEVGNTYELSPLYSDGATNDDVVFMSSDESVLSISNRIITTKQKGFANVNVISKYDSRVRNTFLVIVNKTDNSIPFSIELDKYNISNDNTNANSTTIGINQALADAKSSGYTRVQLPKGYYVIDTSVTTPKVIPNDGIVGWDWTFNCGGICVPSKIELDLCDSILTMMPTKATDYSIITVGCEDDVIIKNGTIIGDRETHIYGSHYINKGGNELEYGLIDSITGLPSDNNGTNHARTINYITEFPNEPFYIMPIENTAHNSVDGGRCFVYCYDIDNTFLGEVMSQSLDNPDEHWGAYLDPITLIENTKKIKIVFWNEGESLSGLYFMSTQGNHITHEFGTGITLCNCKNVLLDNLIVKNCIGDCVGTTAPPLTATVDNAIIKNCTLENSRRQGISFVGSGDKYLVHKCNIGKINGIDPQCGIDIEHYGYVSNLIISECNFYDNYKFDIISYNGEYVEIKNNNFNGGMARTFGKGLLVHHNNFEYKINGRKAHKGWIWSIDDGEENLFYNNTVNCLEDSLIKQAGGFVEGAGSYAFSNEIHNSYIGIYNNSSTHNKIYNGSLVLTQNEFLNNISNLELMDNSSMNIQTDSGGKTFLIERCNFNNSYCQGGNENTIISNSTFIGDDYVLKGSQTKFMNCTFKSNSHFIKYGEFTWMTFENCYIETVRETLLYYHELRFINCHIKFIGGDTNVVGWLWEGYDTPNHTFINCTFESELPVKITGGTITNPTVIGQVVFE